MDLKSYRDIQARREVVAVCMATRLLEETKRAGRMGLDWSKNSLVTRIVMENCKSYMVPCAEMAQSMLFSSGVWASFRAQEKKGTTTLTFQTTPMTEEERKKEEVCEFYKKTEDYTEDEAEAWNMVRRALGKIDPAGSPPDK